LLAWIQIAGGVHGIYAASQFLGGGDHLGLATLLPAMGGLFFYLVALLAGTLLLRDSAIGIPLSLFVQAVQVPSFVVGSFVWSISAGPKMVIGLSGFSLRLLVDLGSYFQVGVDNQARGFVGLNVLAGFWIYYLAWRYPKRVTPHSG
jgi:hypothetical protein